MDNITEKPAQNAVQEQLWTAAQEQSGEKTPLREKAAKRSTVRVMVEGGVCIALSIALSYLKIPIGMEFGGFGGSIDLVMIPLIIFAMRSNLGWGVGAGLVFGILKFIFANGAAINWVSIIFDYGVAYAMVGLAGLFHKHFKLMPVAAFVGCLGRFAIHFLSGVTVYAQYLPEEFMGIDKPSVALYSLLYNGTYMLPNTIIAVAVCCLLLAMPRILKQPE